MSGGVFLMQNDTTLVEMRETAYDSESLLQELLAKYPSLLAGDQINSEAPRRWLLVAREMAVPDEQDGASRWSLDHLFLDQEGVPTLVEVKRSSDTRIRREVVGQMLDYAANAVAYWPVEHIRAHFEAQCERDGVDPEHRIAELLADETNTEAFWKTVKTNLQAGRIRMVFVADYIPAELQRIIEFLNGQMNPAEVLGVTIPQYEGQGRRLFVPRVIGATATAQQQKGNVRRESRQWDEPTFFTEFSTTRPIEEQQVARTLYKWAMDNDATIEWGRGAIYGSLLPTWEGRGVRYTPLQIVTSGSTYFQFSMLKHRPPFDALELRLRILEDLNAALGLNLPPEAADRLPTIQMSRLAEGDRLARFLEVMARFLGKIREDTSNQGD